MSEIIINDLRVNPNADGKAIYDAIHIKSTASKGPIYLDGEDVKELLAENSRLRNEIQLLLHVGKEVED